MEVTRSKQFRKRTRSIESEGGDDPASRPDAATLQALALAQRERASGPGVSASAARVASAAPVDAAQASAAAPSALKP